MQIIGQDLNASIAEKDSEKMLFQYIKGSTQGRSHIHAYIATKTFAEKII